MRPSVPAAIAIALAVLSPVVAQGQPVSDPRAAEFTASPSHNAVDANGNPILTGYSLEFYLVGASSPFQTQPLGKPTPDSTGLIHIDFATTLTAFPPPGVVYEARVAAIGPGGTARSAVSNQFQFTDPCAAGATLTPTSANVSAAAGTGSVAVAAGSACSWTAVSNAQWITVTAGGTGTGNATVSYSFTANTATTSRVGTITIAGNSFSVTQAGASCTYTLLPTTVAAPAAGTTGSISVTTSAGCTWTATSAATWARITAGASGTGNGTVSYAIDANPAGTSRSTTFTIGDRTFAITQAGATCTFTISPTTLSAPAAGTTGSINVTTLAGCLWTASSGATWARITAGATGTGDGTVSYTVDANPAGASRSTTLTVAGKTFSITQAGAACTFTISPTSVTAPAAGSTGSINVTTLTGCSWTASSGASWATITAGATGTGTGTVNYSIAPNTATSSRSTTLTIAGTTFSIAQDAAPCTFTVTPTSSTVAAAGGTITFSISTTTGCSWSASSNQAWVTFPNGQTGSGSGTLAAQVAANTSNTSRSATLTIAGVAVTVTQQAAGIQPPANLRIIR